MLLAVQNSFNGVGITVSCLHNISLTGQLIFINLLGYIIGTCIRAD